MTSRHALEAAYREFGPKVLSYLRSRIRDRHDCEELLQEVFVICARDWDSLNRAESKEAWLIGIARNLIREHHRQRKHPSAEALLELIESTDTHKELDGDLARMRSAIAGLPSTFREVIEMRLADELSYVEIAEALGVPVGTVRSRLHNGIKLLKETIASGMSFSEKGAV